MVNNPQADPDWKLYPSKKWQDYNGQKVCHYWQIRGNCYADCRNAATHISKDKFSMDIYYTFNAYRKKFRGE